MAVIYPPGVLLPARRRQRQRGGRLRRAPTPRWKITRLGDSYGCRLSRLSVEAPLSGLLGSLVVPRSSPSAGFRWAKRPFKGINRQISSTQCQPKLRQYRSQPAAHNYPLALSPLPPSPQAHKPRSRMSCSTSSWPMASQVSTSFFAALASRSAHCAHEVREVRFSRRPVPLPVFNSKATWSGTNKTCQQLCFAFPKPLESTIKPNHPPTPWGGWQGPLTQ
jgi:hypothetical protein